MKTEVSKAGAIITEAILDQAIAAAEAGSLDGLKYDQSNWSQSVLGFARRIAGLPELNLGPQFDEIIYTPRAYRIQLLMRCQSPDILRVMRAVRHDGVIDLSGANLRGVVLRWAKLDRAYLIEADLSGADLRDVSLYRANLARAKLVRANLEGAFMLRIDLHRADLRGANLQCVDLHGDLSEANLAGADLRHSMLARLNLFRSNLAGAKLDMADLRGADMAFSNLTNATFHMADLRRADLSYSIGANLNWDNFIGANLKGVYFDSSQKRS